MLYNSNPKIYHATVSPSLIRVREVTLNLKKKHSFVLLPSSKILALVHFTNMAQYLCFFLVSFSFVFYHFRNDHSCINFAND